jgi:queuine tRNA-ribosyltransferase
VCARWSRAYLRHLLQVGDPSAARLVTVHNLAWTFALVASLRAAVVEGTYAARRAAVLAVWGDAERRGAREASR